MKINSALGYNYVALLAVSAPVREKLEQYVGMDIYSVHVRERIGLGLDEQTAHIQVLEAYATELGERKVSESSL